MAEQPSAACVCGEINSRHCPVHGQGEVESAANEQRIEELEEAIRNVLDVVTGWTHSMTDGEKFRAIKEIGYDALGIEEEA